MLRLRIVTLMNIFACYAGDKPLILESLSFMDDNIKIETFIDDDQL